MLNAITITDLHKSFGANHVLRGVNLTVEPGESMVVIGGSGSGKSVLIKHIIGLLKPDRGSILVDGEEVTTMRERQLKELRKKFGMLFQAAALFDSLTVGENVAFALVEHTRLSRAEIADRVREKLTLVGLPGTEDLFPAELSGGMKKRVGLARALAIEPEVILYDEPTTGLDPIMADAINDLIVEMRERFAITSIAITHDMVSAYKIGHRLAMLYQGKIIFTGTPEECKNTTDPMVRQFITGSSVGPITSV
ncbi:MAG: ABC transporter ATP-binding protein [Nitrospinae bacterium]|nr:ABC transporter ATP-binding protein [Nitrospinota bacterium]MCH7645693.1 ABC transporter ATP-binding protein [Nitrospinota bacterium]MCH7768966.1 ABC transporter ATP-binding protein [Nitrospinota bacterium]